MKLSFLFLCIYCIGLQNVLAQNKVVADSLLHLVKNPKIADTTKIKAYNDLGYQYASSNAKQAKKYIRKALSLSKEKYKLRGEAGAYNTMGIVFYYQKEYDSASFYFNRALDVNQRLGHLWGEASALNQMGVVQMLQYKYYEAIQSYKKSKTVFEQLNDTLAAAKSTENIGLVYLNMGDYQRSTDHIYKAIKVYEAMSNNEGIGRGYLRIARIYFKQKDYKNSLIAYQKALQIGKNEGNYFQIERTQVGIATTYLESRNYKEALEYYTLAMETREKRNTAKVIMPAIVGLGKTYYYLKDYEKALSMYALALDSGIEKRDLHYRAQAKIQMGKCYRDINQLQQAKKSVEEGLAIARKIENLEHETNALETLASLEEKLGNPNRSLSLYKEFQKINDSINNTEREKQIRELQTIYETEQKEAKLTIQEQEIENLIKEVKIGNLQKTIYAIGMFSFIAISGLLFFVFKQRIKKTRIQKEKQEEIYKQEIEFKKKELASQTLHLVQKNSFIQELKESLERIHSTPELFKVEFKRLVMLLKKESAEEKDWEVFKTYFTDVHNNFDKKLKSVYKEISEKEIRLASFLRMKLSTKEIATMFNVLPDSVLKSKYRLKKKLNLDKETDLGEFLASL